MNLLHPDIRTLEIHPIPLARLLYRSASLGNRERDDLGVPLLLDAIGDAASLGFNCLHIAGDEPLHCPALHSLCGEAHRRGMQTTLQLPTTAVTPRLMDELRGSVDLLGIVAEGRPAFQGRVRKCQRIRMARECGIPVVAIFGLTRRNMSDLEWAAQFAVENGAAAMAVRTGNITEEQLATAWMVVEFLRELYRSRLAIGFEAPNRHSVPVEADDLIQWRHGLATRKQALGEVVSPIVIDSDGTVLPLRRDLHRSLAFGNLRQQRLSRLAESWIAHRSDDFIRCYLDALVLAQMGGHTFTDFFGLLSEEAGRSRRTAMAAAG